ncbi:hypothetical protein HYDPIDRAFT_106090 [Hydnomerulius pinastri MD-312]|nr:hypothetical protein HYDPIDRAFT_106090 [Hydnomerulius pinastri MD-312]
MCRPRFLNHADIWLKICQHIYGPPHFSYGDELRVDSDYIEPRISLAGLARTCRALHKPALDVLWKELPDMTPLIKCLPRDLWCEDSDGVLHFMRALTRSDLSVFCTYASRVRLLGFHCGNTYNTVSHINAAILHEIFRALRLWEPLWCSLLPQLVDFAWDDPQEANLPLLPLLLCKGVQYLSLPSECWSTDPPTLAILSSLATSVPDVLEFAIPRICMALPVLPLDLETQVVLSHIITRWGCLESLHTFPLLEEAMSHLSSMASLRRLSIWGADDPPGHQARHLIRFQSDMVQLDLQSDDYLSLSGFLAHFHFSPKQLLIRTRRTQWATTMEEFFTDLPAHICTTSLLRLRLTTATNIHYTNIPEESILRIETIRPLFLYRNLMDLWVGGFCTSYIHDEGLLEMGRAWPHLQFLELGCRSQSIYPTAAISALGLIGLVELCPKLIVLGLDLDVVGLCTVTLSPQLVLRTCQSRLEYLFVGPTQITPENTLQLSNTLATLFPRLEEIGYLRGEYLDISFGMMWDEVNSDLRILRQTQANGAQSDGMYSELPLY